MPELANTLDHHLRILSERLDAAVRRTTCGRPGDRASTDDFLVATAQHLTAVVETITPAVHHRLPDGRRLARDYLRAAKRLEQGLVVAKAKQYGQAQNIGRSWDEVWSRIADDLTGISVLERTLVDRLSQVLSDGEKRHLGDRLALRTAHSPTRPHPHLPHRGVAGRIARRLLGRADRLWDVLEGRSTRPLSAP